MGVIIFFGLMINLIVAFIMQGVASEKGHDGAIYFLLCFFLGFIGWLIVIALPDRSTKKSIYVTSQAPITTKQNTEFDASVQKLKEIQQLYDAGVFSSEEFENEKEKIMEVIEKNLEGNN